MCVLMYRCAIVGYSSGAKALLWGMSATAVQHWHLSDSLACPGGKYFHIVPPVHAIGGQLLPTDVANVDYSRFEEIWI